MRIFFYYKLLNSNILVYLENYAKNELIMFICRFYLSYK